MPLESFVQLPPDSTGKRLRAVFENVGGQDVYTQVVEEREPASFWVHFDRVAPAANKYMAHLWNGSATHVAKVNQVVFYVTSLTAATGVILEQYLCRTSARTAGTSVTVNPYDTSEPVPAGIVAETNPTNVTEGPILRRAFHTSEEPALTSASLVGGLAFDSAYQVVWQRANNLKALILRQNQGLAVRNVTSSTVGVLSYAVEFSAEPV